MTAGNLIEDDAQITASLERVADWIRHTQKKAW